MSDDCRPGSPEQRIKRFLDGCAYLLLRDAPEGTLTKHEEIKHERYEISVSSCPAWVSGLIDAGSYSPRGNSDEEEARFRCLLDRLDERAPERLREKSGQTGTQKRAFSGFKRFGQNIRDALSTLPRSIRITAFVMADRYIAYPRKQASTPRGKRGRASCMIWTGCLWSNTKESRRCFWINPHMRLPLSTSDYAKKNEVMRSMNRQE